MSAWSLLEEASSEDDPAGEGTPPPACVAAGTRRRGRPRLSDAELRRPRRRQRIHRVRSDQEVHDEIVHVCAGEGHPVWHSALRVVGTPLQQDMARLLHENVQLVTPPNVEKLFERVFGPRPRSTVPIAAEADGMSVPRQFLRNAVQELACVVFHLSRMHWASVISMLGPKIASGDLLPIATLTYMQYDETPLRAAMRSKRRLYGKTTILASGVSTEMCKIENSELSLGFIVRRRSDNHHLFIRTELPCPLQVANRSTAEVLIRELQDHLAVPLLAGLRNEFGFHLSLSTRDRAGSNLRAERAMRSLDQTSVGLGLPCILHCCHTVSGRALLTIQPIVSGTISLGLAFLPTGSFDSFRAALVQELVDSVVVREGHPPPRESPISQHTQNVLDSWEKAVPGQLSRRRRIVLESSLRGNWQLDCVEVFVPQGLDGDALQVGFLWGLLP